MKVLYTAAHAVEGSEEIALGGGAAICRQLSQQWARTRPFDFEVLGPSILGPSAPSGHDLITFGERDYARFCRDFERATTAEILRHDPRDTVVLANDISEGPDFRTLSQSGFAITTIYHVDVVAYVAAMYGRGWVRPETTVRWYEALRHLPLPSMLGLVWAKQGDSVRYSRRLLVPSGEMKQVLERCYPRDARGKVSVLPWGAERPQFEPSAIQAAAAAIRGEYRIADDAIVLLTLSRISPEKNQELLLEALLDWEQQPDFPQRPVVLLLCGGAAYMQGRRYLRRLQNAASRLRRIEVRFPGHVTGLRKQACFALADLYVFPSRHESYGLTLLEAMQAGLPAICLEHSGAVEVMQPELGIVVPRGSARGMRRELRAAIATLALDADRRARIRPAARAYAEARSFPHTANQLAEMLLESGGQSQRR